MLVLVFLGLVDGVAIAAFGWLLRFRDSYNEGRIYMAV